eukprot:2954085-Prymnesium_polylepis.1
MLGINQRWYGALSDELLTTSMLGIKPTAGISVYPLLLQNWTVDCGAHRHWQGTGHWHFAALRHWPCTGHSVPHCSQALPGTGSPRALSLSIYRVSIDCLY